ncbi:MAG: stage III sporulation protein AC [Aristaeellaceae bacterium]
MQLEILFQIAGIGVLTTVIAAVLASSGRNELANLAGVAGLAIVLLLVVNVLSELFSSVRTIFQLY